jgi:hypothetical protein
MKSNAARVLDGVNVRVGVWVAVLLGKGVAVTAINVPGVPVVVICTICVEVGVPVTDGVKVAVAPPMSVRVAVGVEVATTTSVDVAPCSVTATIFVGGRVGKLNADVFVAVGSTNTVGGGAGGNGLIGRRGFAKSAAYVPPTKQVHIKAKTVRMLTSADPYLFMVKRPLLETRFV